MTKSSSTLGTATGTYNPMPASVQVTFSSDTNMTTVTSADFTVGGTCSGTAISSVTKSGVVATVAISGTLSCANGTTTVLTSTLSGVSDVLGNAGAGSVVGTYTFDNVAPTTTLAPGGGLGALPTAVTATYSADTDMSTVLDSNFSISGTCSGATISSIVRSGKVVTLNITGNSACVITQTQTISVSLVGVKDAVGNTAVGTQSVTYTKF